MAAAAGGSSRGAVSSGGADSSPACPGGKADCELLHRQLKSSDAFFSFVGLRNEIIPTHYSRAASLFLVLLEECVSKES